MQVIGICSGTPQSVDKNFGCTREHLGAPTTCLGAPTTMQAAPRITVQQSAKTSSLGSMLVHQEPLLLLIIQRLLNLLNSVCILIHISMYLCIMVSMFECNNIVTHL